MGSFDIPAHPIAATTPVVRRWRGATVQNDHTGRGQQAHHLIQHYIPHSAIHASGVLAIGPFLDAEPETRESQIESAVHHRAQIMTELWEIEAPPSIPPEYLSVDSRM